MSEYADAVQRCFGISDNFVAASDHNYRCKCDACREWWLTMGPENNGPGDCKFGPFGDELWADFAEKRGLTVEEAKRVSCMTREEWDEDGEPLDPLGWEDTFTDWDEED